MNYSFFSTLAAIGVGPRNIKSAIDFQIFRHLCKAKIFKVLSWLMVVIVNKDATRDRNDFYYIAVLPIAISPSSS